jgi:hypothetical protein
MAIRIFYRKVGKGIDGGDDELAMLVTAGLMGIHLALMCQ